MQTETMIQKQTIIENAYLDVQPPKTAKTLKSFIQDTIATDFRTIRTISRYRYTPNLKRSQVLFPRHLSRPNTRSTAEAMRPAGGDNGSSLPLEVTPKSSTGWWGRV